MIVCLIGHLSVCSAQQFENESTFSSTSHRASQWYRMVQSDHRNVFDVMKAMRLDSTAVSSSKSREWKEATKWIARRRAYADANGNVDRLVAFSNSKQSESTLSTPVWKPVGPFAWDSSAKMATGSMGIGVVRCHVVEPNDPNLVVIGTISAGIWRSTNAGSTWTNVALEHPIQAVWRLAMSGTTIYAATDAGLFVSRDKGLTFSKSPLVGDVGLATAVGIDQCAVSPTDSKRVVIATLGRLFLSTNGGASWTSAGSLSGTWWDLQWHPTKSDIVYALVQQGGHIAFVRSTASGVKFDVVGEGYPEVTNGHVMARALLAVSPSAPRFVSVLIGGGIRDDVSGVYGLYVSYDEGATFEHRCCGQVNGPEPANAKTNINLFDYDATGNGLGQITWDMGFAVSSIDTSFMVAAGVFPYRSTDGGRSWTVMPPMHYDVQSVSIQGDVLWLTHDGGITRSLDRGLTIQDRSFGISAMEIWGFDQSHDGRVMALGAYHLPIFIRDTLVYNPSKLIDGWYAWSGADAMGANVNPLATQWIYAKPWTSVRGLRTKTKAVPPQSQELGIDLGYLSFSNICVDPQNFNTLVACDHDKQRIVISRDNANKWSTLRQFSNWVYRVRMYSEDGNHLLVLADQGLWRSTDQGVTWKDITPAPLVHKNQGMQDMAFAYDDPDHIYVAFGGHQNEAKVAESTDGGRTWTDMSNGLPSFAIKTIIPRSGYSNELYVGTSFGVYQWTPQNGWQEYGAAMPITDVNFLHIDAPHDILRAATLRGLWQIDLSSQSRPRARISRDADTVACSRTPIQFGCRSAALETMSFKREWLFPGGEPATSSAQMVNVRYDTPGVYDVTLIVSNEYGSDTAIENRSVIVLPSQCEGFDKVSGNAVDLTDPDDHVTLARLASISTEFSFTAWVKPVGLQPSFSAILCTEDDQGAGQEIGMQFVNEKNEIGYLWKDGHWWWNSGLVVKPDEWSHVALTVDTNGATVYVNGVGRTDFVKLPVQNLAALVLKLGTYHNWPSRNFNGYIDEVGFYGRKLTQSEVRRGMHKTKLYDEPVLLAYYQFNESFSNAVFDKVAARDGVREAGASIIRSGALVGDAESELEDMQTDVHRLIFDELGDEVDLTNNTDGGQVLLTRMKVQPDSIPPFVNFISNRSWILDVFAVDDRAHEIEMIWTNTARLIDTAVASKRDFKTYTRQGWSTERGWSQSLTEQPSVYDKTEQTLRTRFSRGVSAPHQWAIGVIGGPVGVNDPTQQETAVLTPQPTSDILIVSTQKPYSEFRIFDGRGSLRSTVVGPETTSTSYDVRWLPVGVYLLEVNNSRTLFRILR
ncbi:MAG: PKD domain-containing protein [Candidatus Kapabacteria bacterium]|nr:PKD domain-containing protein [Candidatus Kapabacteria bacterium]